MLEGRQPEPFVYTSKGALASLGGGRGVAEVFGVRLSGFPAWLLWRGYYLSFVPGFATKVRILVQWLLDLVRRAEHGADRARSRRGRRATSATARGDRVFEEGNRADGFYAVIEGAFELTVRGPDGAATVRRIGPGGHFGERVLLGEGLRTGTVRALEDSVVLVVGAEDFQRLTRALPPLRSYFDDYIAATFRRWPQVSRRRVSCALAGRICGEPLYHLRERCDLVSRWTLAAGGPRGETATQMTGAAEFRAIFPARAEGATRRAAELHWAHGGTTGTVWFAGACVAIAPRQREAASGGRQRR